MTAPEKMSETQIEEIREEYIAWTGDFYRCESTELAAYTAAVISARDVQWQAMVDDLAAENENLRAVMIAAAEEIHEHWQAHCDDEGYGPANLMRRLEKGIPVEYAYKAGDFDELMGKRDALAAEVDRLQAQINNVDNEWQSRLDAAVRDEREQMLAPLTDEQIHDAFQQRSKDKATERRLIVDAIVSQLRARHA